MWEKVLFPKKSTTHSKELDKFNAIKAKTKLALTILLPWCFFALMLRSMIYVLGAVFLDFLLFLAGSAGLFLFIKVVVLKKDYELTLYQRVILAYHKHIFYSGIIFSIISSITLIVLGITAGLLMLVLEILLFPPVIAYYLFLVRNYSDLFEKKFGY